MPSRVLILREPGLAAPLSVALAAEGFECVALPVTNTEFVQPLNFTAVAEPWIAFTSANGVRGLFRALAQNGHLLPSTTRIACVGKSTAETVRELFARRADLVSPVADGAHLAEALAKSLPAGTELLYPCPGGHDSDFADICRKHGLVVRSLTVYRTNLIHPQALQEKLFELPNCEYVVFYAPSAVRAFCAACPLPWEMTAVAIGTTTQRALIAAGHCKTIVAEFPSVDEVANAIRFADCNDWEHEHA